jgi:alpha-tubulin suppressor-like RCC1 family protein
MNQSLSHSCSCLFEPYFSQIKDLDNIGIRKVAAGTHHSLCSDVNGNLFAFGRADRVQLGIHGGAGADFQTDAGFFVNHPVRVDFEEDEKVTDIACGGSHCLATTESGNLYTWGSGEGGMLGLGRDRDEHRPRKVNLAKSAPPGEDGVQIKVLSIQGGGQHSAITCVMARPNEKMT